MDFVHVSPKVERRIAAFKQSGNAGIALAQKATRIIEKLASGTARVHRAAVGNPTKYGEKRIRKCRKYDLGSGYRLITLRRGSLISVSFLGTHDECHRWLENADGTEPVGTGKGRLFRICPRTFPASEAADDALAEARDEAGDDSLAGLSDQDLRRIFCGLVESARKRLC
jgi:hypothetical protein